MGLARGRAAQEDSRAQHNSYCSLTMASRPAGLSTPNGHRTEEEKKITSAKEKCILWGSRSVDIFEKIDQIGEGTYGCVQIPLLELLLTSQRL